MGDLFSRMSGDEVLVIVVVVIVFSFLLIVSIAGIWRAHRRTEIEASLKQDMLDRGMSADEIEKVLKATKG